MTNATAEVWTHGGAGLDDGAGAMVARSMIVARDALNLALPSEMITDTALSILLRTFVAFVDARELTIEHLSNGGFATPTNVARWLKALECESLISVAIDGTGICRLSSTGLNRMRGALAAVVQSQTDLHT